MVLTYENWCQREMRHRKVLYILTFQKVNIKTCTTVVLTYENWWQPSCLANP